MAYHHFEHWHKFPFSEEIKRAVWDCGADKSPGPHGFSFEFIRRFWDIIGNDFVLAIQEFFTSGSFPKGCNASFIALIPKVVSPKLVKDFRPISLIGCQYKITGKILANKLARVIDSLIPRYSLLLLKADKFWMAQ